MILRQLRVLHDNNEENFEIKKERVVIGRGKKCDIVLDSNEISRRHLAIVSKHDQSYVENLSSSGEILLNGELVEYSEIKENDELVVGPYTLFLSQGNAASTGASAMDNSDEAGESFEKIEDNSPAEEGFVPVDSNADDQLASPDLNLLAGGENISADNDINFPATADSRAEDPGRGDLIHEDPEEDIDDGTMLSDGATVVHDQGQSYGILKITKGPKQGEEIKLQHGSEWVIGRDTSCHICIEEKKISREHFKVIQIGKNFRVQDLGSTRGTRLNGVSVKDAPLQAFDSIQMGPVEIQFLIVSEQHAVAIAPAATALTAAPENSEDGSEKSDPGFYAPAPYDDNLEEVEGADDPIEGTEHASFGVDNNESTVIDDGQSAGSAKGAALFLKGKNWWQEQPKKRKLMLLGIIFLLLLLPFLGGESEDSSVEVAQEEESQNTAEETNNDFENAALSERVSKDFNELPKKMQKEVESDYQKAKKAKAARDWNKASEYANRVLKAVKKYKDADQILSEAQMHVNDKYVGSLNDDRQAIEDARILNQQKIKDLVAAGRLAIKEERWEDAEEACAKALNLDPSDVDADQCYGAAVAKTPNISLDQLPSRTPTADPYEKLSNDLLSELSTYRRQFQEASLRIQEGNFRDAWMPLSDLEKRMGRLLKELDNNGRMPASVRQNVLSPAKALESQITEALDTIQTSLKSEYQSQMADADQAISDKQYARAKEIYDTLMQKEPHFEEPRRRQEQLYTKIISQAKDNFHEALIYESVGAIDKALENFEKTRYLLENVKNASARRYFKKAKNKIKRLKP